MAFQPVTTGTPSRSTGIAPARNKVTRPPLTQKGDAMVGDLRTDALHEAVAQAEIPDQTLIGLLVLALAGRNISVQSGASDDVYGFARMERHAAQLVDSDGKLTFDRDTLRVAARSASAAKAARPC